MGRRRRRGLSRDEAIFKICTASDRTRSRVRDDARVSDDDDDASDAREDDEGPRAAVDADATRARGDAVERRNDGKREGRTARGVRGRSGRRRVGSRARPEERCDDRWVSDKAREIDGDGRDAEILERVETSGTASASAPGEAVWTPRTVDVRQKSPRQWSPIALAFLGDAVFELYARGVLFYPPAKPLDYDLKTKRLARAEAQDYLLRLLVDGGELSEDEISIVKWGRNAAYGNIPTRLKGKGKGGHGTYRNASALECLVGYLYVADRARLEEIMAVIMSESAIAAATEV